MNDAPDFAFQAFGHSLLALTFGAAIMVTASLLAERILARAALRRALWQAATLGLCVLFAFELTGTTHGLSSFLASSDDSTTSRGETEPAPADIHNPPRSEPADPDLSLSSAVDDPLTAFASQPPLPFLNAYESACLEPLPFPIERDDFFSEMTHQTEYDQPQASEENSVAALPATTLPASSQPQRKDASGYASTAIGILTLLWLGGTCLFGGRAALARARLVRLRRQWQPNGDTELESLVETLRHRIGMKQTVRILVTEGLTTPVALGILRPTVLVPHDFTKRFSATQQQVILAHELAHLAGRDPIWLLASELVAALMWWHPLVHIARRRLLAVSEQTADEASTLVPDGPDVLAECLVKLGRRLNGRPRLGWIATEGTGLRSGLAHRVQRLLKLGDRPVCQVTRQVHGANRPVAVVLLMLLTISCTLWVHPRTSLAKGEETMNVLRGSWRQSLAAVAITAFLGPLSTDAAAEEPPEQPPKPAQLEDGSPVDQLLLADRGERERGDRERGEPEARGREREHREREGREQPERGKREGREREERGERERDVEHREREARERAHREREEPRERMTEVLEEFRRRVEEIEHETAEAERDYREGLRELATATRETKEEREENARHVAELEQEIDKRKKELAEEEGKEFEELEKEIDRLVKELEEAREIREELAERAAELQREAERRVNLNNRWVDLKNESLRARSQLTAVETEITRRIRGLTGEIAGHRRAGRHEQAERLQAELQELQERLRGRDLAVPLREKVEDIERRAIQEKIDWGRQYAEKAREAGWHDQAEEVERELRKWHQLLQERRDREHREGMERLEAMERELHEFREAGRHERAEQLEREMHELQQRLNAPRDGERPGPPPELQTRLEHLHVAMENLRAAGLHDEAQHIAEQIERIAHEHHPGPPERHDPDMRPPGPRDEPRREPRGEVAEHPHDQIEQLLRENEGLRRMMQELREGLNELRERR